MLRFMPTLDITAFKPVANSDLDAVQIANGFEAIKAVVNALDSANWATGKIFAPSKLMQEGATDKQTLLWDNALAKWAPGSVAGLLKVAVILNGTTSYTPTAGATKLYTECVAAGGSGGAVASNAGLAGCGGGGGAYSAKWCTTFTSGAITVAVGAGGAAPAIGANNGNAGGDTSFDTASANVVAKGGAGGLTGNATPPAGGSGGLASGGSGDTKLDGGSGGGCINLGGSQTVGGYGGGAARGGGTGTQKHTLGANATTGTAGAAYGGGGGGGAAGNTPGVGAAGGAGANGVLIVWEFA